MAESLTLDTGALIALTRNRQRMVKVIAGAVETDRSVIASSASVAEWW